MKLSITPCDPVFSRPTVSSFRAAAPTVDEDIQDLSEETVIMDRATLFSLMDRCENDDL